MEALQGVWGEGGGGVGGKSGGRREEGWSEGRREREM